MSEVSPRCDIHGVMNKPGLCDQCWSRTRRLRPRLPLHLAGPEWWAIHDAVTNGQTRYMATCAAHGFTEHGVERGCFKCDQGRPILLRPA